jgi:hypothetical protein
MVHRRGERVALFRPLLPKFAELGDGCLLGQLLEGLLFAAPVSAPPLFRVIEV